MAPTSRRNLVVITDEHVNQRTIATSIKALMQVAGLSQTDLAPRVGMDQTAMSKSLSGKRRFTIDEMGAIAAALDTPISTLFLGGDEIVRRAWDAIRRAGAAGPDDGPGRSQYPPWDSNPEPAGNPFCQVIDLARAA
jgi:transcriptional regulator with XRE-family HTH domain